jgi:hypothetical protein
VDGQTFDSRYYLQPIDNLFGRYLPLTIHFEPLRHRIQSMKKIDLIRLNHARAEKFRKFFKKLAGELMIVFGCLIKVVRFFSTKILLSGESTYRPVKFAIRMIL